ncbi:HD family phosphohydrolase [Calditrichota bacterium]
MSESPPDSPGQSRLSFIPAGVQWWHWVIGFSLVLLITILAPRGKSPEFAHLTEGSISPTNVIAPMDFEILKAEDVLKEERDDAAAEVLPVVTQIDSVKEKHITELENFSSEFYHQMNGLPPSLLRVNSNDKRSLKTEDSLLLAKGSEKLFKRFGFRLSSETWNFLMKLYVMDRENKSGVYTQYFDVSMRAILLDLYAQGLLNSSKQSLAHYSGNVMLQSGGEEAVTPLNRLLTMEEANARLSILLSEWFTNKDLPEGVISVSYELVQPYISPNVFYDEAETKRRNETAISRVPLVKGFVKKDELIVGSNIRVTNDHIEKLNSLAIKHAEMDENQGGIGNYLQIFGHFLTGLMIIGMFWMYLALTKKQVWNSAKMMVLLAILIAGIHIFQILVPVRFELSRYTFPIGVGVMLIAILVDRGVALSGLVVMALIAGFLQGNDYPLVFSAIILGSAAAFAVRSVKTRGDVIKTSLYLAVAYLPVVAAFQFMRYESGIPLWMEWLIALGNAFLSPILVLGLVYIFEYLFKLTTDLSLLELVDLNRPLLRELAIKSPGTYHHSIMVGSLAEEAARSIGANALLTRAGAYYHDIGKMENKDYFIENQEAGSKNIHDRLSPEKSAEMVVRHVTAGIELAEKHRLPQQVIAFIPEHHGKTKIAYFFDKAVRERGDGKVEESNFRYPGPNPQTKETGILMLADVVEAATRSAEDHSAKELHSLVDNLIRMRMNDGDLDDCPLTLSEIVQIRDAFLRILSGIYHQRIAYPGQKKKMVADIEVNKPTEVVGEIE